MISGKIFIKLLAIDFGQKRIGLAVSDPFRMFATPLTTLKNNSDFWDNLKKIIDENMIRMIILGYPLKENGEKSDSTLAVEKFKRELEKKTKLEVILFDERYSSEIAKERIIESVKSKKKRRSKELVDMYAAAVILEDYMKENSS
ncbi:putative Holliday junction resolvase [bacterium BMS3Abin04]|nr:putative Holliday junction resolvase [bacterium BMS3Abin04]